MCSNSSETVSSSVRRAETAADWEVIEQALHRVADASRRHGGKAIDRIIEPDRAYAVLRWGNLEVWFVEGYLVTFSVSAPWYTTRKILSELLIVRVGPGGTLRSVAQFLKDQARSARAEMVAVGTAFARSDRALARLYQAEGFKPEAVTLTWEP